MDTATPETCSMCGKQLPGGAKRCPSCGGAPAEGGWWAMQKPDKAHLGEATLLNRLLALAIDLVIVFFIWLALYCIAILLFPDLGLFTLYYARPFKPAPLNGWRGAMLGLNLLLTLAWFHLFESYGGGATPGKRFMGLEITDLDGNPVNAERAFLRMLFRLLTVSTLMLGYLAVLFTKRRQALHDLLAKTVVMQRTG